MAVAYKSAISVGLLYIPVALYKTTRDVSVRFNQLTKDKHERIQYQKYCPSCDKPLKPDEIVKGYEYEKDKYVIITEEDLEKIKTDKDKTIHIQYFTKMNEIDNIYYEKNYYCIPNAGAEKAFELLRQAMLSEKMVAIAKTVIGTKENLIVLYPLKDGITAKTLYYPEEIQEVPASGVRPKLEKEEIDVAKQMIHSLKAEFDITAFRDEYQTRLKDAIEKKIKGQEIVTASEGKESNVINLMEAMLKTMDMAKSGERA